jgi:hypothetical protein
LIVGESWGLMDILGLGREGKEGRKGRKGRKEGKIKERFT